MSSVEAPTAGQEPEPIELTKEQYDAIRSADPASPEVVSFMEQHGLTPGQDATLKVEDSIFRMDTSPNDFGTRVEASAEAQAALRELGAVATTESVSPPRDQA